MSTTAITLSTAAKNAALDAILDLLDDNGPGTLEICNSSDAVLSSHTLSNPAFAPASSGTATANAVISDTSAAAGTASKFFAKDGNGATVFSGTVGTSGEGVNLSSVTIGAGDTVSITAWTVGI